jgi:CBS-domain-containing membrane protein
MKDGHAREQFAVLEQIEEAKARAYNRKCRTGEGSAWFGRKFHERCCEIETEGSLGAPKKGRAITTARPTVTLMEVANRLAAKRIGPIVIVGAGGEVSGIISERDIIRALSMQDLIA